jgi:hypothetical protein
MNRSKYRAENPLPRKFAYSFGFKLLAFERRKRFGTAPIKPISVWTERLPGECNRY